MARESEPLVTIEEGVRGATVASSALPGEGVTTPADAVAAQVASNLVRRTTGKLEAARQDIGYLVDALGLDKATWQGKIEGKIGKLVKENPGLTPNDARVNWAAKAEAYLALTKQYGFSEVDQYSDLTELSGGLVVAMTESGSFVMFGPGTEYNGVRANGDGRFAMTYMKGREGNKKQADGLVPPEIHVKDGAKGAKVIVLKQESVWDDAAAEYVTKEWEPTQDAPSVNKLLEIDHSAIDKAVMDAQGTSRLLKVMVLTDGASAEEVMAAFEGVSDAINRLTGSRALRRPAAGAQEEPMSAPSPAGAVEDEQEELIAPSAPSLPTAVGQEE